MDWTARLAKRRENFSESPYGEVPKVPEAFFGTFGTGQDPRFKNVASDSAGIRDHLLALADAEGIDAAVVRAPQDDDVAGCDGLDDKRLRTYFQMLRASAMRERGECPPDETARALCRSCGPVWLHPTVAAVAPVVDGWPRVLGCPWCHVRRRDAMPRPSGVSATTELCSEAP